MNFNITLNDLMKKNKTTRPELVKYLEKKNNQVLHNWIHGINKPDYTDLVKLSKFFNVSCHYLITGEEWSGYVQNEDGVYISKDELIDLLRYKLNNAPQKKH